MKKPLVFLILSLAFAACNGIDESVGELPAVASGGESVSAAAGVLDLPDSYPQPAQAYPDVPKTLHTFPNGIEVEMTPDSIYILGGDIILSPEQVARLEASGSRSAVNTDFAAKWPWGRIPYVVSADIQGPNLNNVMYAIQLWNMAGTGVELVEGQGSGDYVEFVLTTDMSASSVGKVGGRQRIFLASSEENGIVDFGSVLHEIGHTVGLFHEHARSDRDDYVTIDFDNIKQNQWHNYQKYSVLGEPGLDFGTFDFSSIMMYPSLGMDFAVNNSIPVMTKKNGGYIYEYQSSTLSYGDIEGVQLLYGPPYGKIEREIIDESYSDTWSWDKTERTYSNKIYFYEDKERTIRTVLSNPRWITVRLEHRDDEHMVPDYIYSCFLVEAGAEYVDLGETYMLEENSYGDLIDYEYNNYSFVGVGF